MPKMAAWRSSPCGGSGRRSSWRRAWQRRWRARDGGRSWRWAPPPGPCPWGVRRRPMRPGLALRIPFPVPFSAGRLCSSPLSISEHVVLFHMFNLLSLFRESSKLASPWRLDQCVRLRAPMAIPPSYVDLGKSARDIFNKGYGFGLVKLDVKTKSASGVEFTTSGSSNTDTGKVNGSLETKYKWAEYGLTFTEKWNTDNTLGTEIAIEDQIAKGLKLTFDTTFSPNTGKKSGKIKSAFKRECLNLGCDVDFDFAGPAIHGSAVFGYEGWLAGYQMTFDSAKSKLTRNNFSVGYKTGDFQLHTNVNDGSEFGGSIYQKVSDSLETAVNLAWTAGSNSTRFGIAAKYKLDSTASISAKVNNSSLVGVGYTQTLRPGVKLTLSALIDGKSINAGGHKLGLGLELEA
ncbi:voltage-dependent anion-selective channel protein 2 isoform X1 [Lathamus discolor]